LLWLLGRCFSSQASGHIVALDSLVEHLKRGVVVARSDFFYILAVVFLASCKDKETVFGLFVTETLLLGWDWGDGVVSF
jgi:hypothetical protein